jgi:septal ring factor EnvC (AmiA/AmiB activator)
MRRISIILALSVLAALPVLALTASTSGAAGPTPTRLDDINVREAALAARIGVNRSRLAHLLGALQRFSRDPPPPLLVPAEDARDSVRAAILIRAMTPELQRRARTLSAEAAQLTRLRRAAAAADAERFVAESESADLQRVDGLFASTGSLSPVLLGEAPAQISRPVAARVTAAFGGRLASGTPSRGLEFAAEPGEAVQSPSAAFVDYAGPLQGWGQVVILRAGGGTHLVLAGLSEIVVRPGQSVASGQTIGAMPARVNPAPRLYLEVRHGAEPVDPAPLLAQTAR